MFNLFQYISLPLLFYYYFNKGIESVLLPKYFFTLVSIVLSEVQNVSIFATSAYYALQPPLSKCSNGGIEPTCSIIKLHLYLVLN